MPEDEGKGRPRPFRLRGKSDKTAVKKQVPSANTLLTADASQIQPEPLVEQKGDDEMSEGTEAKVPYQIFTINIQGELEA